MVRIVLYHRPECKYCKQLIRILDGICEDLACTIIYKDADYFMGYNVPRVLISENGAVIVPPNIEEDLRYATPVLEITAVIPGKEHKIAIVGFSSDIKKIEQSVHVLRRLILMMRELEKAYLAL